MDALKWPAILASDGLPEICKFCTHAIASCHSSWFMFPGEQERITAERNESIAARREQQRIEKEQRERERAQRAAADKLERERLEREKAEKRAERARAVREQQAQAEHARREQACP